MSYTAYQLQNDLIAPWRMFAQAGAAFAQAMERGLADSGYEIEQPSALRRFGAACDVFTRMRLTHKRPPFGIAKVETPRGSFAVVEEVVTETPFAKLVRFRKEGVKGEPRVLLSAPMSGHFATLLRETVRTMLTDHEVYITDWSNGRDVPVLAGRFGFDEYVEHIMDFLRAMGEGSHLMSICQPCPASLAAAAIMAEDDDPAQPLSLTLMAGPVDCRINPTKVNELATSKPIEWFETKLISTVPAPHKGFGRRVYPGFVQLTAFMSMNLERHMQSFKAMYDHMVAGDDAAAAQIADFYEEYLAVADLPAEFYLETVRNIFQEHLLPRGLLNWRDRRVNPAAIRRSALLTVEGERDDICSIGQTMAAQELCRSVRPYLRTHHIQTGVGHYGVFSGRKWTNGIYPIVRDSIHAANG
ncbi:polyhydroxyalkanoate depolymerase [Derxia gummosa]|uniref:Polyhydroxyalkanoate depolymerase n=1 Tax=Derxia gummosa DSM 723 TaxID=1121388 RepID=A0A8B6X4V9_9BURK|nr:polyhydroxyalkanoate depolymerase [Derxia gummosa]